MKPAAFITFTVGIFLNAIAVRADAPFPTPDVPARDLEVESANHARRPCIAELDECMREPCCPGLKCTMRLVRGVNPPLRPEFRCRVVW
jgi:hypothetical protein